MTHVDASRTGVRRRWWLIIALVVVAAAVATAVLVMRDDDTKKGTAGPSPSAVASNVPARRVAAFSGSESTTTRTFAAALNWELRWTARSGSGFVVELLKADGTPRGKVVTAGAKTRGSTFVAEAGTFTLKVTSKKPWTIQVFSRPVPKKS